MTDILSHLRSLPALQQPDWEDHSRLAEVRRDLGRMPALVDAEAVRRLRSLLAEAAAGHLRVVQPVTAPRTRRRPIPLTCTARPRSSTSWPER